MTLASVQDTTSAGNRPWPRTRLIVIAGLGATVPRKGEERLLALARAGDDSAYAAALRPVLAATATTDVLIVLTIFLMVVKP
jgi:hypothetical protein